MQPAVICRHPEASNGWTAGKQVQVYDNLLFPNVRPKLAQKVWRAYSTATTLINLILPSGLPMLSPPTLDLERLVRIAHELNQAVLRSASIEQRNELYWALQSERIGQSSG